MKQRRQTERRDSDQQEPGSSYTLAGPKEEREREIGDEEDWRSWLGNLQHRCHLLLSLTFCVAQRVEWHVGQFLSVRQIGRQTDGAEQRPSEALAPFHHSSQSVLLMRPETP